MGCMEASGKIRDERRQLMRRVREDWAVSQLHLVTGDDRLWTDNGMIYDSQVFDINDKEVCRMIMTPREDIFLAASFSEPRQSFDMGDI